MVPFSSTGCKSDLLMAWQFVVAKIIAPQFHILCQMMVTESVIVRFQQDVNLKMQ
jgi:hypothetical protein